MVKYRFLKISPSTTDEFKSVLDDRQTSWMALRPICNSEIFAYMLHVYSRQPIQTKNTAGTSFTVVVTVYQFFSPEKNLLNFVLFIFFLSPLHRKPPTENKTLHYVDDGILAYRTCLL
jgi:hypothetical protein